MSAVTSTDQLLLEPIRVAQRGVDAALILLVQGQEHEVAPLVLFERDVARHREPLLERDARTSPERRAVFIELGGLGALDVDRADAILDDLITDILDDDIASGRLLGVGLDRAARMIERLERPTTRRENQQRRTQYNSGHDTNHLTKLPARPTRARYHHLTRAARSSPTTSTNTLQNSLSLWIERSNQNQPRG